MIVKCDDITCRWNKNNKCINDSIELSSSFRGDSKCITYELLKTSLENSFYTKKLNNNTYILIHNSLENIGEIIEYCYNKYGNCFIDLTLVRGTGNKNRLLQIENDEIKGTYRVDEINMDKNLIKFSCDFIRETKSWNDGILTDVQRRMIEKGMNI